jgi:outer membrane lipoprotein-sorting protein
MIFLLILISSILSNVSERLRDVESIECDFSEVLLFQGDTLNFKGTVYALRDRARIDVFEPEREVMVFKGDSVFIWIEKTDQIYREKTPMVLYDVLFSPEKSYMVDSAGSGWVHLSPLKDENNYPISVKFNKNLLPEKITFIQETGKGMFNFSSYRLNKKYPENFFSLDLPVAANNLKND